MIDYTAASKTYDNTRRSSDVVIERFHRRVRLNGDTAVLDFGCGTGNYLFEIHQRFGCRCHGVEPASGMRAVASAKSAELQIVDGNHEAIPFPAGTFDFAYMTDVIHHVPDLASLFRELRRVLKTGGALCIVTESHSQIDGRFYNRYFPSLAENEKRRYPDIALILNRACDASLASIDVEVLPRSTPSIVSETFLRNVAEKNYSMFRLLPEQEYNAGLQALTGDLGRSFEPAGGGETLLWFRKS
ncbi:methyltransferase domain-containing protein [Telmatospirillum sp.]|uniref:class I SAM-dependent methyltransferase n=1 Tax=Telmatospirillum sp. TaxID=2079197 RepID=UPI0028466DCB|nr:methyltransferase domain-containing protein [Telmatospirillum sp.]MDR3437321.1 methyltransferase domain-containing protein [Telmatospirillum sp.]